MQMEYLLYFPDSIFRYLFIILIITLFSCDGPLEKKGVNIYSDMTLQYGIDFLHQAGNNDEYYMPESIGSGVAIFDSNNDGLMDIYFLNGSNHKNRDDKILSSNKLFVQTEKTTKR